MKNFEINIFLSILAFFAINSCEEPLEEELVDTTRQPRNVLNYRTGPMKIHEMISAVEKLLNFLKTKNKQDDITNKKILKTINNVNNIEEILNNLNN